MFAKVRSSQVDTDKSGLCMRQRGEDSNQKKTDDIARNRTHAVKHEVRELGCLVHVPGFQDHQRYFFEGGRIVGALFSRFAEQRCLLACVMAYNR